MAIREILTFPDPRLALKSTPVETVDDEIKQLIDDMFETMYVAEGVGLAAPQIGVTKRIIVVDCGRREEEEEDGPLRPIEPHRHREPHGHREGRQDLLGRGLPVGAWIHR